VAGAYFLVGDKLNLSWLRTQIAGLPAESHWQTLAKMALSEDVSALQSKIASLVFKLSPEVREPSALINEWETQNKGELDRIRLLLADVRSAGVPDFSMLSVAVRELGRVA
jgi:glutamate dehydrogenase